MNDPLFYQDFCYYPERDTFVIYVYYEILSDFSDDVICGKGTLCIVDNEASAKAICDNLNKSSIRVGERIINGC